MSGLGVAGNAASSPAEGGATGRVDNCGSCPLLWPTALEMGAAAGDACVSGTACAVVLELGAGDCWGAGVALCMGKGAVAWTDGCADAEGVDATGGVGTAVGAADAVVIAAIAGEAAGPGDVGGAATDDVADDEAVCEGANGVRADLAGRSDSADLETADPGDAGGAGSAMDTVVLAAPAVSCFPKSIHTPLAAAGGAACLCVGF